MILPNQVFNYLALNFYSLIQCFATMQQLYSFGTEMEKILAALSISTLTNLSARVDHTENELRRVINSDEAIQTQTNK